MKLMRTILTSFDLNMMSYTVYVGECPFFKVELKLLAFWSYRFKSQDSRQHAKQWAIMKIYFPPRGDE